MLSRLGVEFSDEELGEMVGRLWDHMGWWENDGEMVGKLWDHMGWWENYGAMVENDGVIVGK